MPIDPEKLKALKANGPAKVGGQRVKAAPKPVQTAQGKAAAEVVSAVNRLGGRQIPKVAEVWMFHADNQIQVFKQPKIIAAVAANAWCIQGKSVTKPMGPENMTEALQHMSIEGLQQLSSMLGMPPGGGMPPGMGMPGMPGMPGFGDVPNFDEAQDEEEAPELVE